MVVADKADLGREVKRDAQGAANEGRADARRLRNERKVARSKRALLPFSTIL